MCSLPVFILSYSFSQDKTILFWEPGFKNPQRGNPENGLQQTKTDARERRNEADMREIISFNDNWNFSKDGTHWEPVTLPHTWNAIDGMDGQGEYYRGVCRYEKSFATPPLRDGTRVFLEVLACSLSGTVIVNGRELCRHKGGYSSFVTDITEALCPSCSSTASPGQQDTDARKTNTLTILADNSPQSDVYPQMADFTFYGGLYRGVNLLILPETHFDVCFHGAPA